MSKQIHLKVNLQKNATGKYVLYIILYTFYVEMICKNEEKYNYLMRFPICLVQISLKYNFSIKFINYVCFYFFKNNFVVVLFCFC